jgi:acyl-CoA dehydrogenase
MLLERLFAAARTRTPIASLDEYRARFAELEAERELGTFDRAVLGGAIADRLGYAFAGGYQSALRALVPGIASIARVVGLSATEEQGAHPRHIRTRLEGGRLNGEKRWATLAPIADALLVACSIGSGDDGKNRLKLVRVDTRASGVGIEPMPETPFMPEIPHAKVTLREVSVSEADVLPGDGYEAYLKPFRTVEDVHVLGAACGYLVGVARAFEWPHEVVEDVSSAIAALDAIAAMPPIRPETHIALAGALRAARGAMERAEPCWSSVGDEEAMRWRRDRSALDVAGRARGERAEAAWRRLA